MTIDDVRAMVAKAFDVFIADDLRTLEERMRRDIASTGTEDEDALDRPPDPDAVWTRVTVEEVLMNRQAVLAQLRAERLADTAFLESVRTAIVGA